MSSILKSFLQHGVLCDAFGLDYLTVLCTCKRGQYTIRKMNEIRDFKYFEICENGDILIPTTITRGSDLIGNFQVNLCTKTGDPIEISAPISILISIGINQINLNEILEDQTYPILLCLYQEFNVVMKLSSESGSLLLGNYLDYKVHLKWDSYDLPSDARLELASSKDSLEIYNKYAIKEKFFGLKPEHVNPTILTEGKIVYGVKIDPHCTNSYTIFYLPRIYDHYYNCEVRLKDIRDPTLPGCPINGVKWEYNSVESTEELLDWKPKDNQYTSLCLCFTSYDYKNPYNFYEVSLDYENF